MEVLPKSGSGGAVLPPETDRADGTVDVIRLCLLSVAASGKSTFRKAHPIYRGCRIVDVAELLPTPSFPVKCLLYVGRLVPFFKKLAAKTPSQRAKKKEHYFPRIKRYLREQTEDTVVLANRGPEDPSQFLGFRMAAVLIPIEAHERNCAGRKRQMRNPIPLLHHRSTRFENVRKMREQLTAYAAAHGLEVFESFEEAIDGMLGRAGGRADAPVTRTLEH